MGAVCLCEGEQETGDNFWVIAPKRNSSQGERASSLVPADPGDTISRVFSTQKHLRNTVQGHVTGVCVYHHVRNGGSSEWIGSSDVGPLGGQLTVACS